MYERVEEMDGIGLHRTDYGAPQAPHERAHPPRRRYTPRGRALPQQMYVRNATETATALIRRRMLTVRDYDLLHALLVAGLFSTDQLRRLYWPAAAGSKTVTNRLGKLHYRRVVDTTPEAREYLRRMGLVPGNIYTLGKVGAAALYLHYGVNRDQMRERKRYQIGRGATLIYHDLLAAEVYVRAHETARRLRAEIVWYGERQGAVREGGGRELVRPDGTFELSGPGGRRLACALEIDRGKTDWREKVAAYDSARDRQVWHKADPATPRLDGVLVVLADRFFDEAAGWIRQEARLMDFYLKRWSTFQRTPLLAAWHDPKRRETVALLDEAAGRAGPDMGADGTAAGSGAVG